jgi:hypothetical protein
VTPPPAQDLPDHGSENTISPGLIAGIATGAVIMLVILAALIWRKSRSRKPRSVSLFY